MLTEVWDGVTPLRQVGLGVAKLTHEHVEQMSLFEDPNMAYYREWDRRYDEEASKREDARMLAYERHKKDDALLFRYEDGEQALAAVKKAVRENPKLRFRRGRMPDGTDCFELTEGTKVLERHAVGNEL